MEIQARRFLRVSLLPVTERAKRRMKRGKTRCMALIHNGINKENLING